MSHKISVCICTRNRPEDLKKALNSLEASTYPIFEVIVSDDSTNSDTQTLVRAYSKVKYLAGPRRGLGANRNNALEAVTGSYVLFIDDDVVLGEQFLETIFNCLETYVAKVGSEVDNVVVTGLEHARGELVFPHEQDFLGHQKVNYGQGDPLKTVVINSAVFPTTVFKKVLFDEKLVYGCDEVDLTTRAVQAGFNILLCPEAVNLHFPATANRDFYEAYHEASRIYVTFKRYFSTENNKLKAIAFAAIAIPHAVAYTLKQKGLKGVLKAVQMLRTAFSYVIQEYLIKGRRHQQSLG